MVAFHLLPHLFKWRNKGRRVLPLPNEFDLQMYDSQPLKVGMSMADSLAFGVLKVGAPTSIENIDDSSRINDRGSRRPKRSNHHLARYFKNWY